MVMKENISDDLGFVLSICLVIAYVEVVKAEGEILFWDEDDKNWFCFGNI